MDFKNKVTMAIEDWRDFYDDENISIAIGKVTFLSTAPNSHKHVYSEEVLQEYAPTYLGKFLVAEYNDTIGDVLTHTNKQTIVGYIPLNQEVYYDRDENGYLQASVDVVISKIYAPQVYKLFKDKNYRAVSVEQLVGFTPETEEFENGTFDKIITGFEGIGITILGLEYNGSIPTAKMTIIQMSEDNVKDIETEYVQYSETKKDLKDDDKMSIILNKLEEINSKLECNKEEKMAKSTEIIKCAVSIGDDLWGKIYCSLKEKYPRADGDWITSKYRIVGIYEEGTEKFVIVEDCYDDVKKFKIIFTLTETELELSDELLEVAVDFVEVGQMEMFTSDEFSKYEAELKPVQAEEIPEVKAPEEEEMACGDKEKMADLEVKLSEAEVKMASLELELKELKEFKMSTLNAQKDSVVYATLSQVKDFVDIETYSKFEESGKICEYANIHGWKNEVLASVADLALAKMSELTSKENGILDMGTVGLYGNNAKKESIYD